MPDPLCGFATLQARRLRSQPLRRSMVDAIYLGWRKVLILNNRERLFSEQPLMTRCVSR